MNTKLKILVSAGAVVVVVLVVFLVVSPSEQPEVPGDETPGGEIAVPETGNIDELMAVLDLLADDEGVFALQDENDGSTASTDTEEVGDFGQSSDDF